MQGMSTHISKTDSQTTSTILNTGEWTRDGKDTPVYAVVSAVAEVEQTDPIELPPLYDAIDPEALNTLFTARSDPGLDQITFQYAGYTIVIQASGEVQVRSATTT